MKGIWQWISDHLAALVSLGVLISSRINSKKISALSVTVDGQMSNLLRATQAEAQASGEVEGRQHALDESLARTKEKERIKDRDSSAPKVEGE